ncbi:MAG TPA: nucleotidyltransferase domain-containing protein [Candidatus Mediterraneibacter caccavium]|uniref:Nucleotidyltransferase domain-containing protein n=1 Tax=Candidatus Mediterraneibacter caccavium TaxID=2838661 RepID=A0A9D2ASM3_9FIRM|nr:nucleotidyltransferase domain-containing protein [Lachnoclostridium sp. An76]OUN35059.1 toxin [Lachnoclostridium sp. An76]HIX48428.1 nucleotidyltransferase domain-containing protein [Candidatus Mediterraneibacter caccavium]
MTADEVIARTAELCRKYHAREVVLFGSRAKGTALERSDIDIAVSGVEGFDALLEEVEEIPTLYTVDLLDMDTCGNGLLLEDIRQYGRKI